MVVEDKLAELACISHCQYTFYIVIKLFYAERPSMENITVFPGLPLSSEAVFLPNETRVRCSRTPFRALLRNGELVTRSVMIIISSEGIYQCVGEQSLTGQDETDFTGEPGSNVYILTQGTC